MPLRQAGNQGTDKVNVAEGCPYMPSMVYFCCWARDVTAVFRPVSAWLFIVPGP